MFSKMKRSTLRGFEQLSVPLGELINQHPALKNRVQATIGRFSAIWMRQATQNLWKVDNTCFLDELDAPNGVIIAANHRSFFDLYVCSTYLINFYPHLIERLFFPVRSAFFYTHPLGVVVNLSLSGGSMWPPVFRDERRKELNPIGLSQLAEVMTRGALLGMHPEGKRGTGDDPYELLPAKPGLGLLMQECHPDTVILPYFTTGMSNDVVELVRRNFRKPGNRGEWVSLRFGAPFPVSRALEDRDPLEATEYVMDHIRALGEEDRKMRETLGPA